MQVLPPSCPPLPGLPPLFWTRVAERIACWQDFYAKPDSSQASFDPMRESCIARIITRLKRFYADKNIGRSLFEMADYVPRLSVMDSRN